MYYEQSSRAAEEKKREEARKRREEARKQREADNARRRREAKEKRLRKADERVNSTNFDIRTGAENSFYTEQENNGIMKPNKPKFDSIDQIKDAQDAQRKLIHDMEKKQWNELSTGTDEIQIINKQNVSDAKQGLANLDNELTDAYGLGSNGYLNKNSKSYGQKNPADAHKYAQGTGGAKRVTDKSFQMARNPENAYGIGTGGAKRVTDESLQMARNPENAYGIGTGGAKRVTDKSLQMARNPENAYGIGTGGAKRVTDESLQMARNPENAYGIGTGGVRGNESTAENAYGQHTGGVSGNYKPPALREAEQAVTAFDIAFSIIEEQTGVSDQATIMANIETAARGENGAIDESSTWGQAAMLLNEAEMETGMTLGEADHLLAVEQGNFEEYKKVEAVKAEAAERFGELEDYDDSPVDWQNNSVDLVGQRADELEYYSKATGDVDDLLTGGKIAEKFDLLSNKEKDALAYGLLSGEMSGKEYSLLTDEEKDAIVYDILSGGMSHAEYAVLSDEEKEIAYDFLPANEKRKLRAAFFSEYENMDEDMIAQYTDDEALGSRKLELAEGDAGRKHYEDNYEIAMDGELGDLDGMQLFIRAENDIQNIINETNSEIEAIPGFKQIKQDTINMGLADFDDAMQAWMEGDSSDIQTLLTVTYGGTMLLDDEDLDFNDFRDEYVKYCWDSQKYEDDLIKPILDARDQKLEKYHETMRPYLEEQMKFVETGDGFYMTLTPDIIEYAVAFAGEQGAPLIDSEMTDVLGAGAGVAVAFITGNPAAGALISIMTIMGGRELDKKHLWDKTASALEHYIDTDKPLFVSVHDDRVDIIEIEKE